MTHHLPKSYWRHPVRGSLVDQLTKESPRQRYLRQQSERRFVERHGPLPPLLRGEIGRFDGIVFIRSLPESHASP